MRFCPRPVPVTRRLAITLLSMVAAAGLTGRAEAIDNTADEAGVFSIGAASVDITPDRPVRLSGYGNRRAESEGVDDPLFAKALVVQAADDKAPSLLIAVDTCILSLAIRDEIAAKIETAHGVPRERTTINVSHSHTTPMLRGTIPNLFGEDIPPDHAKRIDEYTDRFIASCVEAAGEAMKSREPCHVSWGQGAVAFAANRRTPGGPTDHAVPVLCVRGMDGRLKAIVTNYACHCTTLGGDHNRVTPDWAGYAAAALEARHPGSAVLVTIGCGGDQNPAPRTGLDLARQHGLALADEVLRVLQRPLTPVSGPLDVRYRTVQLDLAAAQPAAHWKSLAGQTDAIGRHARLQLARLERGESLAKTVELPVQTWQWGDDLAMAFLGGEVVVDYSLRLKQELDESRLWVSAYSNAVPCYIPSERVLREGRYEGASAMVYYDQPGPFRAGVEQTVVEAVKGQLEPVFAAHAVQPELIEAARAILDDAVPRERREELIAQHAKSSAALLRLLVTDLEPGSAEERRRIPWIWRVTVAAGKRNDLAEVASILDASLPHDGEPLREWQAVVVGGGVINGIGLVPDWPSDRVAAIFEKERRLEPRWTKALDEAAAMADDEAVITGTRYDALRMVALDDWTTARPILERYLTAENRELQQGAVSGLADAKHSEAARLLLAALDRLEGANREFALDALVRGPNRMKATLDAIEAGTLKAETLGEDRLKTMRDSQDSDVRERAARLP